MAKKDKKEMHDPIWTHKVATDSIDAKGEEISLIADETTLRMLADVMGVQKISNLHAVCKLKRVQGNRSIYVSGCVKGQVQQPCVVTLTPVVTDIEETFEAWYADQDNAVSMEKARRDLLLQKGATEVPILEESDDPEPIDDGFIDVADLATQYLSLAIEPYPHAEGAHFPVGDDMPEQEIRAAGRQENSNPFAALKSWRERHFNKPEGEE